MATERAPEQNPNVVYVDKGGSGFGGVLVGIAVLALVAIVAFFLLQSSNNDRMRTDAVTSAASSVADSASSAANSVGDAASKTADAVTPK